MLPQNKPDRIRILFDDHRLVANAGLLLPATLARHLGLRELVDHHLDLGGAPGRANTGDKMLTLVASALAGGDCINAADALRAGGTVGVLGCVVKAPSTLGTFLRSFRWGHVRQLDRVSRQLLARAWAAGAGPGDSPLTIDLDSTICETYGLAKEGARHHGYTGARGYHPLLAIAAGTGEVLMSRLREGRANTARGAAHFLRETVGRVRYSGARGQLTVRADSGFYAHTVVAACREMDVRFSSTIRQRASLRDLIEAIPEEDWTPIPYWMDGAADVAETTYTPFQTKPDAAPVRLIVRRVKPTPGSQLALFAIMSRERAKLSYRWQAAYIERWATSRGGLIRDEETREPFRVPSCPLCASQIVDKDGVPLTAEEMGRKRRTCAGCGSALWQADPKGPKRYPLADYIKKRMKGFFELLIGDEIHEYKGRGSAQGIAAGVLADSCGRSLTLTGTLTGGYSSTLFHLLYRFSPAIRTEFGRSEEGRWIQRYGFEEHTIGKDDDDSVEDGRFSRRRRYRKVVRERPGLAPAALFHLIGNSVFLRLSDVASGLPSYEEQILLSSMDSEPDSYGYTQWGAYGTLYDKLRAALADALAKGSRKLLSTYLQSLLALSRRLHTGRDRLRPGVGRRAGGGAAPVRGEALSKGEGPAGPGGGGEA